ncbi:MAG: hypothetical protein U0746_13980 [Gemmataceae bacterium]
MPEPTLSVVVAVWRDASGLADCLMALAGQRGELAEVLVVANVAIPESLAARFPWVVWLNGPAGALTPKLWALGLGAARGDAVAITTAHFTPVTGWARAIRAAHVHSDAAAVGGPIDPPAAGAVNWATYLLRYNAYLGVEPKRNVDDIPGDNASYKREALVAHADFWRDGFWEPDVHRRLREHGAKLLHVPAARVRQNASFGFRGFLWQRFRHGVVFGRTRALAHGGWFRALALAAAPLLPLWFFAKIAARVVWAGQYRVRFCMTAPVLACFLIAWSLGEVCGYLLPAVRRDAGPKYAKSLLA